MNASLQQWLGVLLITASCHDFVEAMPLNLPFYAVDPAPVCTTPMNMWQENFTSPDGTVSDAGITAWSETNSSPHGTFGVVSNEFKVNNITINGAGVWTSAVIGISGKANIAVSVDVRSTGGLGSLTGSTIMVIIRARATATDEYYYFDNVKVSGQATVDIQPVASAGQQLTCGQNTVTLTGNSSTPGVTYSWTGPDDFSDVASVTTITQAGDYTLTVSNPVNGCSSTAVIAVQQDLSTCRTSN
jgi:hypothetical protein